MANITVRRNGENKPAPVAQPSTWQPFRLMRDLMGWDPFEEMTPFVQSTMPTGFLPAFEVKETKDGYVFTADLPGVKQGDIDVSMTGNRLTISGKREAEQKQETDTYYAYERSYGTFQRTFTLPDGIDMGGIGADLKDGVLTVSVKKLPEAQPKKIPVQSPTTKS